MRKDFHTATGKLIGYTVKSGSTVVGGREDVYDKNGFCLGHIDDSGTYDDTGRKISTSKVPGLLFQESEQVAQEHQLAHVNFFTGTKFSRKFT